MPRKHNPFCVTPFQTVLLKAYPDIDLLRINPESPRDVDRTVRRHRTGDTLFDFLWLELDDDCSCVGSAIWRLENAIEDIGAVVRQLHDADAVPIKPSNPGDGSRNSKKT